MTQSFVGERLNYIFQGLQGFIGIQPMNLEDFTEVNLSLNFCK